MALIAHVVMERARDGDQSVADLMDSSRRLLGIWNVMPEVPALLHEVQVECTFPDGTKLVTVHSPGKYLYVHLSLYIGINLYADDSILNFESDTRLWRHEISTLWKFPSCSIE